MKSPLPDRFAWVKVGGEAGQDLPDIFRRKNFERESGRREHWNTFWWGFGEPRVCAIRHLGDKPKAVFSKVQKTRPEDKCRRGVRLWRKYWHDGELRDIPGHVIVTSKRPKDVSKSRHYALVCRSDGPIEKSGEEYEDIRENEELRNILNDGRGGKSRGRTTRVVRRTSVPGAGKPKPHQVIAFVDLVYPYGVKLENSRKLTDKELYLLQSVSQLETTMEEEMAMKKWRQVVAEIRSAE